MARAVAGETRAALAAITGVDGQGAMLWEGGLAGQFTYYDIDLSEAVTADPMQAVFIAPTSDPTGASGAWVRREFEVLELGWFGAVADNATDILPAINAAFDLAEYLNVPSTTNSTIYRGGPPLRIPPGQFYCSGTWEPLYTGRIQGAGGLGWGAPTQVRFPAGVTGVRLQAHNTSGSTTVDVTNHFAGDRMVISDIYFLGGMADGVAEGEYHGIHPKRALFLERCTFENFQGDGFYANAGFGAGSPSEGNINVSRVTNCEFISCRNGISLEGDDANACTFISCSFMYNRQWGIKEDSFLGNHHYGHHFDANARNTWNDGTAGKPTAYVSHGGNQYFAINGQETGASTNAPSGTTADNTWWGYWQVGGPHAGGVPAWTNGISVRPGGPLLINGLSNGSTALGLHIESNGVTQVDQAAFLSGVLGERFFVSTGTMVRNRDGSLIVSTGGAKWGGNFNVIGDFHARSSSNILGPNSGTAADGVTTLASRNAAHTFEAHIYDASGNDTSGVYAYLGFYEALGTILTAAGSRQHRFRIANNDIVYVNTDGINLETGKVYKVAGTQVVGAQGAAVAADATDLATALTLVNQLKARLRAHGLIA